MPIPFLFLQAIDLCGVRMIQKPVYHQQTIFEQNVLRHKVLWNVLFLKVI